ncbi:MAG: hypothetical protein WA324_20915 [Bryobacteraceae bacterium]
MPKELELVRAARARNAPDQTFAFEATDASTGLGHGQSNLVCDPLDGRPSLSLPAGKLHHAGEDQLLRRKKVRASQDLRRDKRSVEETERVEYVAYLEAKVGSPLLTRDARTDKGRNVSLLAIFQTFGYTLGSDRVDAHGFTKTFLTEGTALTVPSVF